MRIFISLFLIFIHTSAFADIVWTNVVGYSKLQQWNVIANNASGVVVLGGFGGIACTGSNNAETCDNCSGLYTEVCNRTRAYPELRLTVTFSSTDTAGLAVGRPIIAVSTGSGEAAPAALSGMIATPTTTATAGEVATVSVPWSSICGAFDPDTPDTTCSMSNGSQSFELGIDKDGDGALEDDEDTITFTIVAHKPTDAEFKDACAATPCSGDAKQYGLHNFSLFPGDEKGYIENTTFTPNPSRPIAMVHFLGWEGGYGALTTQPDIIASISVTNNAIDKDFITGLRNGTEFFFHSSSEDDAGNIGLHLRAEDADCPGPLINSRCRAVTPSAVGGLFKDNCFIATAAYGSTMEPEVQTLRSFRDTYLLKSTLGKAFVRAYYKHSPAMADWISLSENRRAMTRFALAPIVISVSAFMHAPQLCLMGFALFAFFVLLSVYRKTLQPVLRKGRK